MHVSTVVLIHRGPRDERGLQTAQEEQLQRRDQDEKQWGAPSWRDGVYLPGRCPTSLHRGGWDKIQQPAVPCLSSQSPVRDLEVPTFLPQLFPGLSTALGTPLAFRPCSLGTAERQSQAGARRVGMRKFMCIFVYIFARTVLALWVNIVPIPGKTHQQEIVSDFKECTV